MKTILIYLLFTPLVVFAEVVAQNFTIDFTDQVSEGTRHFQGWLQIIPDGGLVKSDDDAGAFQKFEASSTATLFRLYVSLLSEDPPIQTRLVKDVSSKELSNGVKFKDLFPTIGSVGVYSVPEQVGWVAVIGSKSDNSTNEYILDDGIYFLESVSGGWLPIGNFSAGKYFVVPRLTPDHKPITQDVKILNVTSSDLAKQGQGISRFDWGKLPTATDKIAIQARQITISRVEKLMRDREKDPDNPLKPDSGESP